MGPADDILSLIPQQPPFVMVGHLLSADDQCTRTGYRVSKDNLFIENGRWSEPGLLENMAQTAAAGAGYMARQKNEPVRIGFIGSIKNFEVVALPAVDDELITETIVRDRVFNTLVVEAGVWRNGTLIARCEMNIFIIE